MAKFRLGYTLFRAGNNLMGANITLALLVSLLILSLGSKLFSIILREKPGNLEQVHIFRCKNATATQQYRAFDQ